jgi:hypothetical protein
MAMSFPVASLGQRCRLVFLSQRSTSLGLSCIFRVMCLNNKKLVYKQHKRSSITHWAFSTMVQSLQRAAAGSLLVLCFISACSACGNPMGTQSYSLGEGEQLRHRRPGPKPAYMQSELNRTRACTHP